MTDKFAVSDIFVNDTSVLTPRSAVAIIIVDESNRLLLQLRDDKEGIFFPNHWGCFGGAIDAGETPKEAAIRELQEELNITFDAADLGAFIHIGFTPKPDAASDVERHFFSLSVQADILQRLTLGEGRDVNFFTFDAAMRLANVTPYDKFALWLYCNQKRLED